jgi:hypothetical protein
LSTSARAGGQRGADEILVSIGNLPEDPAANDRTAEVLGDIARG